MGIVKNILLFLAFITTVVVASMMLLNEEEKMKEQTFCYSKNGQCFDEKREIKQNTCYNTSKNTRNGKCTCSTVEVPCP